LDNAQTVAWRPVLLLAAGIVVAHVLVNATSPYGFHRDEFLYFAMGRHLRLFAMDFPPFIAIAAEASRAFGDSLVLIRLLPALAAAGMIIITALIVHELQGGRFAQLLACTAVLVSPLFMRAGNLFQPVVFDQLWWTLALYSLARVANQKGAQPNDWLLLGAACGLGLLTKFIILVLWASILAALLLTLLRRTLRSRWPWLALLVALAIGAPSMIGQIRLGFPVVSQMGDLQSSQLARVTAADFMLGQVMMFGPAFLLALWGAACLLGHRSFAQQRALGWACVIAFAAVLMLRGKPYYAGPIYPALFAAGAAALEGMTRTAFYRAAGLGLIALYGLITLPIGLPILPPGPMARYTTALGMTSATTTNTGVVLELPQDYADMLGWEQQVAAVARVFSALPPPERERAVLVASNYGEAGALDFFGPKYGLPPAIAPLGSYWFFGPGERPGAVVVSIGTPPEELLTFFRSAILVTIVNEPWVVPEERDVPIVVARDPYRPLQAVWPEFKGRN
jgi:4-amino-4-deoxy-L-arabinose transferase-like glycosyltransferase